VNKYFHPVPHFYVHFRLIRNHFKRLKPIARASEQGKQWRTRLNGRQTTVKAVQTVTVRAKQPNNQTPNNQMGNPVAILNA